MDWAPSPLPQESSDCTDRDYTRRVEGFVIVAIVGMFLLHVLGSLRRWSSIGVLHAVVTGVDTLSYPLVGYTIGSMDSSNWYVDDFALWAVFLLLLLGSTDCLTVCRLSDIDNWKSIYVKHLFKAIFVVWIVVKVAFYDHQNGQDPHYLWRPLTAILFVGVIKWYMRIASMRMVSKSNLSKSVKVIADYMKYKDNLLVSFDPVTMQGYSYLVAGEKHCVSKLSDCTPWYEKHDLKITTVEEIWRCTRKLLWRHDAAKDSLEKTKRVQSPKDLCLSMALSKMLNRRFAGFELSEAHLDKTHSLVFDGLLIGAGHPHERAFSIIEEELGFVHDLYYTRYFYLYQKGRYFLSACPLLGVTIFITAVLAFLELYQLYLYLASGWFKVALICSYVSLSSTFLQTRAGACLEMLIGLLLRFKAFHPWKNKLGQYCLLRDLGRKSRFRNFLHYATLGLVDKARKKGKHRSNGNLTLTNWVASLQKNGVIHGDLSWACDAIPTDGRVRVTSTILIWHIATTMCHQLDDQTKDMDTYFATASILSLYCMHLLAFAPNLLPDHSSLSEPILDQAIHEAGKLLGKRKKLVERALMDDIQDSTLWWKVLSDFWAVMMLYISPSDDARSHLEVLAKGGEFITHIWALLTHAGVLKRNRDPTPPQGIV
ncbi:hypothetical protein BS78_05G273300 [Paspalum vaginatum]|nr:hypothetical protein BS78_05G273300 [Paspalum vaginatum]